jgi:hypothetical protein
MSHTDDTSDQQRVYVYASPEIQKLLENYETDFAELLRREGKTVKQEVARDPVASADDPNASRDVVTVLVASAAVAAVLTPTIRHAIEVLANKPIIIERVSYKPVEDSSGNVVRDSQGEPILQRVYDTEVINPPQSGGDNTLVEINMWGFIIKFGHEQKPAQGEPA